MFKNEEVNLKLTDSKLYLSNDPGVWVFICNNVLSINSKKDILTIVLRGDGGNLRKIESNFDNWYVRVSCTYAEYDGETNVMIYKFRLLE